MARRFNGRARPLIALLGALYACAEPGEPDVDAPPPVDDASDAPAPADLGRTRARRLSRTEYARTLTDLLGRPVDASDLPADDALAGFDHLEENASTSPLLVELWERYAERLAAEAMRDPSPPPTVIHLEGEGPDVTASAGGPAGNAWNLWSEGAVGATIPIASAGTWEVSARAWASQAGDELASLTLLVDGEPLSTHEIAASDAGSAEVVQVRTPLSAGEHRVEVRFDNDFWEGPEGADRNLLVDWITVSGPHLAPDEIVPNPFREAMLACTPTGPSTRTCAEAALGPFVRRAWRRTPDASALEPYLALVQSEVDRGADWPAALTAGIQAVLLSPRFLYHLYEVEPDPVDGDRVLLDDTSVASRLSYFLWSSMPDDALLALADQGALHDPAVLAAEARRMLNDPRADALATGFAAQWLFTRAVHDLRPDPWEFADFDPEIIPDMEAEALAFFRTFLHTERPLDDLLTATETTVSARLAAHYGLPAPATDPGPVSLASTDRRGVLGHAALLAATSFPTRTSPVKRGKFILGQLLCDEPKPPPPNVEGLVEVSEQPTTVRERLEAHRADPACAVCHDTLDPLGFGLERYDAIGRFRDLDAGRPIDASGTLPDGRTFSGGAALAEVLADDPRFSRCAVEKLYTYALARVPGPGHDAELDALTDSARSAGFALSDAVEAIVRSPAFRTQPVSP